MYKHLLFIPSFEMLSSMDKALIYVANFFGSIIILFNQNSFFWILIMMHSGNAPVQGC